MASIFSKIVAGEIPCYKVAENDKFLAFLDVFPLTKAHVLVIPKHEIDYIFDIEDGDLGEIMVFAKRVAKAIKLAFPAPKVGMTVIGLEVPHAHIHLMPIFGVNDIDFKKEKLQLTKEEFVEIAEAISSKFI